ncbi:hypothetical protein H7D62_016770, partial [Brucella melitensis]|nr:hypothetical protein [Brucella melitensis]
PGPLSCIDPGGEFFLRFHERIEQAEAKPDIFVSRQSGTGIANYYNLCPSSPAARDYVVTLVADITSRYQPDMVELESVNFMG